MFEGILLVKGVKSEETVEVLVLFGKEELMRLFEIIK